MRNQNRQQVLKKVPKNRQDRDRHQNHHENHQRNEDDRHENESDHDRPRNLQRNLLQSKLARHFGAKSNQMFAQNLSKSPKLQPKHPQKRNRPVDQDQNRGQKLSESLIPIHYQNLHDHQNEWDRRKHLHESYPNPKQNLNLPSQKMLESQVLKNDRSVEKGDRKVGQKVREKVHEKVPESQKVHRKSQKIKKAKNKRIMFMNQSHQCDLSRHPNGG